MSSADRIQPWHLEWTEEHITRFWNWLGSNPNFAQHYFTYQVGDSILDEISRYVGMNGVVVDLGAGPGYLVEKMLRRGIRTLAVDTSLDSIKIVRERYHQNPYFLGAQLSTMDVVPLQASHADVTLLIETIEHLDDSSLENIVDEMRRITKPGGYVVVTTPNDEILAEQQTMCPNCGCIYHRVQHMRSWTVESLRQTMTDSGFKEVACYATLFSRRNKPLRLIQRLKHGITGAKPPHLLYIGKLDRK